MRVPIGFLIASAFALPAAARTVTLRGEYGCGLFVHQIQRLEGTQTVMQNAMLRANGRETPESKAAAASAAADVVRLSNTVCRPISGKFKVLESRQIDGGEAVRIEPSKTESLWVIGPF